MAADGSVVIEAKFDAKKAQAELNRLKKRIFDLEAEIQRSKDARLPLVEQLDELAVKADAAAAKLAEMQAAPAGTYSTEAIARQQETVTALGKRWETVHAQIKRYDTAIANSTGKLDKAQARAVELSAQVSGIGAASEDAGKRADSAFAKFEKRLVGLAKRVFVFSLFTRALRSFRTYLGGLIKANADAAAAIGNLKNAFAGLIEPIVNAVIPVLTTFLNILTYVISAISTLFGLTGKATTGLNNQAEALENTGGAAKDAEKQLASFDEINKLAGSGGGGGAGAPEVTAPTFDFDPASIPEKLKAAIDSFTLFFKDIFFEWGEGTTPEAIVEKGIAGLFTLLGAVAGFSIGGPAGAVKGAVLGALFSVAFSAITFNHDGTVSDTELATLIADAVGGLVGGAIGVLSGGGVAGALIGFTVGAGVTATLLGFIVDKDKKLSDAAIETMVLSGVIGVLGGILGAVLGGPFGAALGFAIGAGVTLLVQSIFPSKSTDFSDTEYGQHLQALVDDATERVEIAEDIKARINSITGEVDESTMADFSLAQQLINEIFSMDGIENKTAEEIAIIQGKIETLNSLGLDGLNLAFDESTGHINLTRDEVDALMESIMKQYELQALGEAYVKQYEQQYEAIKQLSEASDGLEEATGALAEAQDAYGQVLEKYKDTDLVWLAREDPQRYAAVKKEIDDAKEALDLASEAVNTNQEAVSILQTAVDDSVESLANLEIALTNLRTGASENGEAIIQSTIDEIKKNTPGLKKAMEESTDAMNEAFKTAAGIQQGDSSVYANYADNITRGLDNGLRESGPQLALTMEEMSDMLNRTFEEANEISSPSGLYETEGEYIMLGLANGIINNAYRPIDAIKSVLNDMLYWAEKGINAIVSKFNGVAADINSNADGTPVRLLDSVYIPRLAQGAVIPPNREFLAVLGDQRSGTNIETPLSTMVQAFKTALADMGGSRGEAVMVVDGEAFGRLAYRLGGKESTRVGVSLTGGGIA